MTQKIQFLISMSSLDDSTQIEARSTSFRNVFLWSPTDALLIIAVGGVLAMIGAIGHGYLMDKISSKKNFLINILAWGAAICLAIVATSLNGYHLANGIHLNTAGTASE